MDNSSCSTLWFTDWEPTFEPTCRIPRTRRCTTTPKLWHNKYLLHDTLVSVVELYIYIYIYIYIYLFIYYIYIYYICIFIIYIYYIYYIYIYIYIFIIYLLYSKYQINILNIYLCFKYVIFYI